jgi:hypothetical protein
MSVRAACLIAACIAVSGCGTNETYWTKLCDERLAGKELIASGKAKVARVVLFDPWDTPGFWPDMERHPGCVFPASLSFTGDGKRRGVFEGQWRSASSNVLSISGSGEWKRVQWGHLPNEQLVFEFATITVHGAGDISPEARKAFAASLTPPT